MLTESAVTTSVAVSDLGRAREFYIGTLGLRPREDSLERSVEGAVVLVAGDGTRLRLYEKEGFRPSENLVATFEVQDVGRAIQDLERRGVRFESFDLPDTRSQGPIALTGSHQSAWFRDPDGNILCVHRGLT